MECDREGEIKSWGEMVRDKIESYMWKILLSLKFKNNF